MATSLEIPKSTIDAMRYLFVIENALRELIIEELSKIAGPRWYKERLPGDILTKYRDGLTYERSLRWVQLVPHHPIYYVDFPHLRLIITRKDNWNDAFKRYFFNPDALDATLSEIEYLRNKAAHNRMISTYDLNLLDGTYSKLSTALGEERFLGLAKRCTHLTDLKSVFSRLGEEVETSYQLCRAVQPCAPPTVWPCVESEWWFDESYLGRPTQAIQAYFGLLALYITMPRGRGEGYKIEKWIAEVDLKSAYENASV